MGGEGPNKKMFIVLLLLLNLLQLMNQKRTNADA